MDWKRFFIVMSLMTMWILLAASCVFDKAGFAPPDGMANQNNVVNNNNNNISCVPSNGGVEICDEIDNNCDGQVDEGFNLQNDSDNCGFCGNSCTYPNASAQCLGGLCALMTCSTGWVDLNQDPVNGCEYQCTVTNGGAEICDNLDNDCNGQTDEGFNKQTDSNNCGYCGNVCSVVIPNATSDCVSSQCEMLECSKSGTSHTWWDLNSDSTDGCEYQCQVSMGGHEVCDGYDNDCDGQIDEDCGSLKLLFQFGDQWTSWPTYVADLSGNGNDGVAYGGALLACNTGDFVPGEDQDSCSVAFDGTGYIDIPDSTSLDFGTGSFTFIVLVKTQVANSVTTVFMKQGSGYINLKATKPVGNESTWETRDSEDAYIGARATYPINNDIWHSLIVVRDDINNLLTLYIDGVKNIETADNRTGNFNYSSVLKIARTISGSESFIGNLDEFAVYALGWQEADVIDYHDLLSL